jgi:hypothetical protein
MSQFSAKRRQTEFTHELNAPPEAVFPLLCPVREYDWLPGWSCQMIYSDSGVAEKDCVFRTMPQPGEPSTWCTTFYQPPERIEYVVVGEDSLTRLHIELQRTATGTRLRWTRLFTGLTEEGNANIGWWTRERDEWLAQQLERFLART